MRKRLEEMPEAGEQSLPCCALAVAGRPALAMAGQEGREEMPEAGE